MNHRRNANSINIIQSFRMLKGNTRISVLFEPLWGIPFVLFNFYLSLYMKEVGITDKEIGYLISLGFIVGTVFALISGVITDRLGRKKTTIIFDFISWPLAIVLYAISNSFWMFALATFTNSIVRIVSIDTWRSIFYSHASGIHIRSTSDQQAQQCISNDFRTDHSGNFTVSSYRYTDRELGDSYFLHGIVCCGLRYIQALYRYSARRSHRG